MFFVSTSGTTSDLILGGPVPEVPDHIPCTQHNDYIASKQVCEQMLEDAWELSGANGVICRVGQVAGPVMNAEKGIWAKQEWLPTVCYAPET